MATLAPNAIGRVTAVDPSEGTCGVLFGAGDQAHEVHYRREGGSTYCMLFEPGIVDTFVPKAPLGDADMVRVNAHLATAK
ncbi:MAG TPA: hypothetical protein VFH51_21035 [Myxococcota bacterium]|nr:hypothetical protein [Myxococcota bacterium]